jgi:hypothetical protein
MVQDQYGGDESSEPLEAFPTLSQQQIHSASKDAAAPNDEAAEDTILKYKELMQAEEQALLR